MIQKLYKLLLCFSIGLLFAHGNMSIQDLAKAIDTNTPDHHLVQDFQMVVMGMKKGDPGFGNFGPKTTLAWKEIMSNMSAEPITTSSGYIIRSIGYTENIPALSKYYFLNDGTFNLQTNYKLSISEERIWFASKNVRCRSSVVYASKALGILQTSFASEIRLINKPSIKTNL